MPQPVGSPGEKRSGEQSQTSWADYQKVLRTNEIVSSLIIITSHFPYNGKSLPWYLYFLWAGLAQGSLGSRPKTNPSMDHF